MCIGIPMQVMEVEAGHAWCEGMGERKRINMMLVGEQPVGSWVLVFIDSAREVISVEDAQRITQAVQAVNLAMQGETDLGHLFSDLVDSEPQLPEFLRSKTETIK
jgi:hydrogenase expression/formation protein HypC